MNKVKYLNDVVSTFEAETMVQGMMPLLIETYGSKQMLQKYALIEKFNMQCHKNAMSGSDDFILNAFVLEEKVKELIQDLFVVDFFKIKIFPLIKKEICEISSLKTYLLLHFESIIVNLLEKFFFHVTACQSADNFLIDIIEYCYLKISSQLTSISSVKLIHKAILSKSTGIDDIDSKNSQINFLVAMSCISIIRYITDHLQALPFPITNHLLNTKDAPMILVELIDVRPWEYQEENSREISKIFSENTWASVHDNPKILSVLNQYEGQVWISIYNLFLMHSTKYEITEFRKNVLLKLKKYMHQRLYDALPPLVNLYRSLEELNMSGSAASSLSTKTFLVEMIPDLFLINYGNKSKVDIEKVSSTILKKYFKEADLKEEMQIVSEVYSTKNLDYFMENPLCGNCGKEATSRCSQCKSEWYCSKECQILRWKSGHKELCVKLKEINKDLELLK